MSSPPVIVDPEDVRALLARFKNRGLVPSALLAQEYERFATAKGRVPRSRTALGRALTVAGGERVIVRTARGRRGAQKVTETHCWRLPEGGDFTGEDAQVVSVLREMTEFGDGVDYLPCDRVWEEYETAARRGGWSSPLSRRGLSRWMNRHGFLNQQYGRRRCWLSSHTKLDRICPPEA